MIKKKHIVIGSIVIFLTTILIIFALNTYSGNNICDRILWSVNKKNLIENKIANISFGSSYPNKIELVDEEKDAFIKELKNSKFIRSNWDGQFIGGSPIEINFKDNSKIYIQYMGGDAFEAYYKKRRYTISNHKLKEILAKHIVNLNQLN